MSRILLVSNEKGTVSILTNLLKTEGYKVVSTGDLSKAIDQITTDEFSLMIVSVNVQADLDLVANAKAKHPAMPVVVITSPGSPMAAAAAKLNPFASAEKPLKVDQLLTIVQKAVDFNDAALTDNVNLNLQLETNYEFANLVAESPAMKAVCQLLNRVAPTDITILISGEPGTGKENVARTVHAHSRRKEKAFVVVECGAADVDTSLFAPGGLIPAAAGGTLFLKRVDALPTGTQETLAKALQERKLPGTEVSIDVRVVASSVASLEQLVGQGAFSANLFKLLKVIVIRIPPLRSRKEDIMPTVRMALHRLMGDDKALPSLDPKVVKALESYDWPGNGESVDRILDLAIQAAKEGRIGLNHLPPDIRRK